MVYFTAIKIYNWTVTSWDFQKSQILMVKKKKKNRDDFDISNACMSPLIYIAFSNAPQCQDQFLQMDQHGPCLFNEINHL